MNQTTRTLAFALVLAVPACGGDPGNADPDAGGDDVVAPDAAAPPDTMVPDTCNPTALPDSLTWYGDNRAGLQAWIDARGCDSAGFDAAAPPVAVFDWDNTMIKGDVGDAITFWMIKNARVKQPPGLDWTATSPFLSDDAATALATACAGTAEGVALPTDVDLDCADEMLSIYIDGKTTGNLAAFTGWNYRRIEPAYAWTAQLLAGYTEDQIRGFANAAIEQHLANDIDTTQTVGTRTVASWFRVYEQQQALVVALQTAGYDVWIVTASPQPVVQEFAERVGVANDHVIGIRSLLDDAGKLTYHFAGCGPVADGDDTMITYIEGKRCWVNKVIYGDDTATAIDRRPDGQRHVFAAGDSDTDADFVRDADYKFVLNRNKKELMCLAYDGLGEDWLINPMFIAPRDMRTTAFPCSTTACKDTGGAGVPCRDDANVVIPDQIDRVY
jgi:phosphoserine phosphatase